MIGAKRRQVFYTELAKLADAGFGIREAARVMLDGKVPAEERQLLERMLAGLDGGTSIAASFGSAGVSEMERGLIEAGERSGKPGQAFTHLADYFGLIASARREALKATIYPLVLLHFGLLLAAIPTDSLLEGFDGAEVVKRLLVGLLVTYGVIALGWLGISWLLRRAPGNASIDRWLNRIPWVGGARRSLSLARFARAYHAGLLAALPMRETVRMAGKASHSAVIAEACGSLEEAVAAGQPIGPAMAAEPAFPSSFARSYVSAEEAGAVDDDLERWAKVFAIEATEAVRTLAAVLPKVGYVLVVGFVVWRIFAAAMGYYGALEQIGA